MRSNFRLSRAMWLFGLVLLVGTAAGAGWVLNHSDAKADPGNQGKGDSQSTPGSDPKGIYAFGYVDVEPGVSKMFPLQPGRVTWVETEGATVKKGAPLLKVDDTITQAKLKEAKIGLENALKNLAKAKLEPLDQKLLVEQQKKAIAAAQEKVNQAQAQLDMKEKIFQDSKLVSEKEIAIVKSMVEEAKAGLDIQKSKLEELKLAEQKAELQLEQAKLDVEHKKNLIQQVELAIKEHQILAPSDGNVLRVNTAVGEVLAPNPMSQPAIQFCPKLPRIIRAEVQQEWASGLEIGQEAIVEDDTTAANKWRGKVRRISDWFTQRRSMIQEPFQFNDVRTLECIVEVTEPEGRPLRIGQRMRVFIKQGGP